MNHDNTGAQYDLFAKEEIETPIPASRRTDPESSKKAETAADVRGQRKFVLDAIRGETDITAKELSEKAGIPTQDTNSQMFRRRLPELEKLGLVARERDERGICKTRVCRACGRQTTYWHEVKQ